MITLPRLTDPATRLLHSRAHLHLIQDEMLHPTCRYKHEELCEVQRQVEILTTRIIALRREVIDDLIHRIGVAKNNLRIVEDAIKDNLPDEVVASLNVRRLHIMHEIEKMWKDLRYHVESGVTI